MALVELQSAQTPHILKECIYLGKFAFFFPFSSEYTKIAVDLNFAVPPLFPFLFSVQFLPDAPHSLFVQAEV